MPKTIITKKKTTKKKKPIKPGGKAPGAIAKAHIAPSRVITLRFSEELISWIDAQAAKHSLSRNHWMDIVMQSAKLHDQASRQSGHQKGFIEGVEAGIDEALNQLKKPDILDLMKNLQDRLKTMK
jgi:hypothetical protein